MEEKRVCPGCQKTLALHLPLGLCPECLIKSGFNTGTDPGRPGMQAGFVPPPIDEVARLFPQLEILELLGKGGMGAVYKARQPALDRFVALKILPAAAGGSGFAERFNREARALARLNHPRIVSVHDFGVSGNLHYLTMEFVDGPNLRQAEQVGRLTPEQALHIVPQICEALQFAHDQGVVHRDIKPENILLDREGRIKITDFGIAKIIGVTTEQTSLTGAKDVVGTPHYMAPEQIETPADVDHRADIYSLGVVFYEMLTGELPLGKFAPPSKKVEIDVRLDDVVLRSLEKEPGRRYQQASDVKTHVETIATTSKAGVPVSTYKAPISYVPALVLYALQSIFLLVAEVTLFRDFELPPIMVDPTGFSHWDFRVFDALGWLSLSLFALALAYIAWGFLHYSCWSALPERYRATTPGRAVGFMFIPFFNFFWAFISFPKLADGFNAWGADVPGLSIKNMSGLAVAKAILFVCFWTIGWIPGLASIISLADLAVFAFYYRGIVSNANLMIRPPGRA